VVVRWKAESVSWGQARLFECAPKSPVPPAMYYDAEAFTNLLLELGEV
jgi:hypothetical protein